MRNCSSIGIPGLLGRMRRMRGDFNTGRGTGEMDVCSLTLRTVQARIVERVFMGVKAFAID